MSIQIIGGNYPGDSTNITDVMVNDMTADGLAPDQFWSNLKQGQWPESVCSFYCSVTINTPESYNVIFMFSPVTFVSGHSYGIELEGASMVSITYRVTST